MRTSETGYQHLMVDLGSSECRNYPGGGNDSAILALTDIPWYPPYPRDTLHYHNCMEIGLCQEGCGTLEMGGQCYSFDAGALLLSPRGAHHAQHNAGQRVTHWRYIAVDTDRLLGETPASARHVIRQALRGAWSGGVFLPEESAQARQGARMFDTIFDAYRLGQAGAIPEIEALVLLLLVRLARCGEFESPAVFSGPYLSPHVQPALQYVARHYAEDVRIGQMARSCSMSESHFRRLFTLLVGCSPLEYLNRYRVHHAISLLCTTHDSMESIASRAGFSSVSTFNRNFMRYAGGESPVQWRKKHVKQHDISR